MGNRDHRTKREGYETWVNCFHYSTPGKSTERTHKSVLTVFRAASLSLITELFIFLAERYDLGPLTLISISSTSSDFYKNNIQSLIFALVIHNSTSCR